MSSSSSDFSSGLRKKGAGEEMEEEGEGKEKEEEGGCEEEAWQHG